MPTMQVHPKALADAMKSILEFTKDPKGDPDIMIDYCDGVLTFTGVGRYNAGRQRLEVETASTESATVMVVAHSGNKGVELDDLAKLASSSTPSKNTGISSAKGNRLTVEIEDGTSIQVLDGNHLVGALPDTGNDLTRHEWLEGKLAEGEWRPATGPLALTIETASRLNKIKSDSEVVDIATTGQLSDHTAMLICGTMFRGLVTTVDRPLFAEGGPWSTGPGTPEKLLPNSL